jgi:hypothetical protein
MVRYAMQLLGFHATWLDITPACCFWESVEHICIYIYIHNASYNVWYVLRWRPNNVLKSKLKKNTFPHFWLRCSQHRSPDLIFTAMNHSVPKWLCAEGEGIDEKVLAEGKGCHAPEVYSTGQPLGPPSLLPARFSVRMLQKWWSS